MSTTIDSLDIQIKTSAGSAADNIEKLADALGKLKENGKISATVNNLTKLKGALDGLKGMSEGLESLARVGEKLKSIQNIGKLSNLASAVSALKKIPDITKNLDTATLDAFADKVKRLSAALAPLVTQINAVGQGFSKLPAKIKQIVSGTERMASATRNAASAQGKHRTALDATNINLAALIQNIQTYVSAMQQVIQTISEFMSQAIEWDGIQARFGRAFGDNAQESLAWVEKLSEGLMINKQEFMQYSSLFSEMLTGFGVNQADAGDMALGYTELAYDIWAAYNDVYKNLGGEEGAIAAVRSAIAGEVEPIRRAGFTIVDSQLAITAAMYGVEYSTQNATEAQKSYLRYLTMVNQAAERNIIGTYAAEMQTAEGAVRTLSQQVKGLQQALGSLLLPMLTTIVPYLTAFVQIVYDAAAAIANFFNLPFFEIDWSRGVDNGAMGGLAEDANAATEGLDAAGKAAKKLKSYTMGFDELNVINPTSDSGAGGAGAGADAGWESLDVDKLWDDSIFNSVKEQVDEIKEKMKDLLAFAVLVGVAIAAWKIPKGIENLKTIFSKSFLGTFVEMFKAAKGGSAAAQSGLTLMFTPLYNAAKFLTGGIFKNGLGAAIMGSGGTSVAAAAAAIAAVVAGIALVAAGLVTVYEDSENFRQGLSAIGDGISWVFDKIGEAFEWVGEKFGELREKLDGIVPPDVLEFFDSLEIGIGDLLVTAGGLILFGPWGLLIEAAVLAIKGIGEAASDAIEPVDLFGEGVSEVTKSKVEPFIEKMDDLDDTLKTLDWSNAIVDDGDLADISAKLGEVVDIIVSELDSDKNKALANIEPLREAMSEEKFANILASVEKSYADQKQIVEDGEARITEILEKASADARALTAEEAAEIDSIQRNMKETGIKYLSESETESNLILQRLKDNAAQLSAEQAAEVIKNAIAARDETIKAAEEQYKSILLEAQRMLDTGTVTKDQYDEIVAAAESAKDDSVTAAEEQYDAIVNTAKTKMGEYAKYIDTETGEIKSKWNVWCEDMSIRFSEMWQDFKQTCSEKWGAIKEWFAETIAPVFTKEYWKKKWDGVKQGTSEKLAEVKASILNKWNEVTKWFDTKVAPKFTKQFWVAKFQGLKDGFVQTIKNMINAGIAKLNELITWLNEKLNFSWEGLEIGGQTIFEGGSVQLFTIPPIPTMASGGYVDAGQMFIAREAGPELVGNINGRTAVANNDQIVSAVSQGVYSAVLAAMGQSNGSNRQNVNVYLDGKQITAAVEKRQSERGLALVGNQLGYAY